MMKTSNDYQGEVDVAGNASRVLQDTCTMDKIDAKNKE